MNTLRRQRIESVFSEEIGFLLLNLTDDALPSLTVTECKIREDGKSMHVGYVFSQWLSDRTELPDLDEAKVLKIIHYLRRELRGKTDLRVIPEIVLRRDRGFENKTRIEEILGGPGSMERSAPHSQA